jgi:uncharacterized protein YndB with AHSA1/START domain
MSPVERTVSESIEIAAAPEAVYALVSDVTAIGRFSPETRGARVLSGAGDRAVGGAHVGMRFAGRNVGSLPWQRWSTLCTVTAADPGREFGFDVAFLGAPIAHWHYALEPVDGGTLVTETWTDRRRGPVGFAMVNGGALLTGVRDRGRHNRAGMRATLERLKAELEAPTAAS